MKKKTLNSMLINKHLVRVAVFFSCTTLSIYSWVDFDSSMEHTPHYKRSIAQSCNDWRMVQWLYQEHLINNYHYAQQARIPKIIHQIWLGSPLPDKEREYVQTWLAHHPDWEYRLWTDEDIEQFGLTNKAAYDASTNWGEKSDIARYEILYRFGGLYVDTDFECLKSFDIFHHSLDFYTGLSFGVGMACTVFNGIIGSVPGHPILKRCIETIGLYNPHEEYPADAIMVRTGPYLLSRCIFESIAYDEVGKTVLFPVTYFYPWPNFFVDNSDNDPASWLKPESYAVHHWHISWDKSKDNECLKKEPPLLVSSLPVSSNNDVAWSILICTLDERVAVFSKVYKKLLSQIKENDLQDVIEVLYCKDNRQHSIGFKRNALLKKSKGAYISYVDDDDDIHEHYIRMIYEALQENPDCVMLKGVITWDGKNPQLFIHSNTYTDYFQEGDIYYRPPNHLNPIKKEIACQFSFPHTNVSEDSDWAMRIARSGLLKKEAIIDEPYYFYHFSTKCH